MAAMNAHIDEAAVAAGREPGSITRVLNVNGRFHTGDGLFEGADVVIELSGALPAITQAFQLARRLGRVGIIGQPPADEIKIPYRQAMFRALTVSFSYSSKFTSWERVLSLFERGAIKPSQFITHVLPLEEWSRGFDLSRSGEAVKVVLEP